MKTKKLIEVVNNMGSKEVITLNELRERICERRMRKLSGAGCAKIAQRKVNVFDTEETDQPATSYTSFAIRKMGYEKAIDLYNAGGSQVAKMVTAEAYILDKIHYIDNGKLYIVDSYK